MKQLQSATLLGTGMSALRSKGSAPEILIAGIGNIFMADDAFGCEVIRALSESSAWPEVAIHDFGIRSYDLAYALIEDYQAVILVDAVSRGAAPGTVFLIEPEIALSTPAEPANVDPHSMDPVLVIRLAEQLGGIKAKLYLVGCEPGALDSDDGQMGLSPCVQAAVPDAVTMINSLVNDLLQEEPLVVAGRE